MHDKPYILSTKVIILDSKDRCLLLKRSMKSKAHGGKWDLPGGKVDPCEDFHHSLLREILEETGLIVEIERVVGSAESETPEKRVAYIVFQAVSRSNDVRLSDEHDEYRWVSRSELGSMDITKQFRKILDTFSYQG